MINVQTFQTSWNQNEKHVDFEFNLVLVCPNTLSWKLITILRFAKLGVILYNFKSYDLLMPH